MFAILRLIPPRLAMHPLDLLMRMCPLAFVQCVFYAWISGELESVRDWSVHEMSWYSAAGLVMNECIAFGLNIVSFTANKKAGGVEHDCGRYVSHRLSPLLRVLRRTDGIVSE